jgi:hypothetical protein
METINKARAALSINLYRKELVSPSINPQPAEIKHHNSAGIRVNISVEGQNKFNGEMSVSANKSNQLKTAESAENDKADLGRKITKQLLENSSESVGKSDENKPKDPIDEMIAQIKKQIEEVIFELKKLNNDKSESALEQKKSLQNQLVELSGQLLALMERKMEQAKST